MLGLHRRIQRRLPAYQRGELPAGEVRWIADHLEQCAGCRAEHEALARFAAQLLAHDPASPPDPARARALLPTLRTALADVHGRAGRPVPRPALAFGAALLLFAAGCLAGSQLFPRQVVRESVREVKVAVPGPVLPARVVHVPVTVEKIVRVPVERVVTRWRTRTVTETRVVYRPATSPAPGHTVGPRPSVAVIKVDAHPQVAMVAGRAVTRPASVEF